MEIKKVDTLGRIGIPKKIRDRYGYFNNVPVVVTVDSQGRIIIEKISISKND